MERNSRKIKKNNNWKQKLQIYRRFRNSGMFLRCVEGSVNSAADADDRARGEVAKGFWAAVDTSPDLRGSKCPLNLRNDGYST